MSFESEELERLERIIEQLNMIVDELSDINVHLKHIEEEHENINANVANVAGLLNLFIKEAT